MLALLVIVLVALINPPVKMLPPVTLPVAVTRPTVVMLPPVTLAVALTMPLVKMLPAVALPVAEILAVANTLAPCTLPVVEINPEEVTEVNVPTEVIFGCAFVVTVPDVTAEVTLPLTLVP